MDAAKVFPPPRDTVPDSAPAEEFFANPLGRHNPPLQRLLRHSSTVARNWEVPALLRDTGSAMGAQRSQRLATRVRDLFRRFRAHGSAMVRGVHAVRKIPAVARNSRVAPLCATQVVRPDVIQVCGITEARKIAAYAQMRHLQFSSKNCNSAISLATCLSLLCAFPNADYFKCDADPSPWRDGFVGKPPFCLNQYYVEPSDEPRLGLDIDDDKLNEWRAHP